ncbi:MAG: amidase, partial [bacterium]
MTTHPLHYLTVSELGGRFRDGSLSPVAVVEHLIERIDRLDPKLGAFRTVTRKRALGEARAAEAALRAGQDLGPLHGIPYVAKDLFDVKGEATMAGTRLLEDNVAEADCHVVRKCAQAGMVLLGKTHTVQFAFGAVGINNDLGTPHNPWNAIHHVPGGSSSGTAVAVAAGLAPVGLGSDTGGSVRIPAALCGIAGLKTTIGRIGRSGVYPLSWTLDSVGPLGRAIEDCALFYQALTGEDPKDETTLGISPHRIDPPSGNSLRGLRMAFCETVFFDDVDPTVTGTVRATGAVFQSLGAQVGTIELPEVSECFTFGKRDLFIAAEAMAVNEHWIENHFDDLDPAIS